PGRFSIESAAEVLAGGERADVSTDRALDVVAFLIDKSLILRAEGAVTTRPVYQMLETMRAFGALELATSGEREDAFEGLARYSVTRGSDAEQGLAGLAQAQWLDGVRDDLENHRAAMKWLIDRGRSAEASAIASGFGMFWLIRGHAAEGLRWFEQILKLPALSSTVEARALIGVRFMCYSPGQLSP